MNVYSKIPRPHRRALNLGIAVVVKRRSHLEAECEGAFELGQPSVRPGDVIGLQIRPSKDAAPPSCVWEHFQEVLNRFCTSNKTEVVYFLNYSKNISCKKIGAFSCGH